MQNKAKIIIPLVVLVIIIVAIGTIINSSIFVQWEPVAIQNSNNSVKLKVYIENSGSMDGYMREKSEFKDAVKSYVNALDLQVDTTELYYINTQISSFKADIANLEEALNPVSFAKSAGSRSNSDIADMLSNIVMQAGDNSVSMFISDCILDVPQGDAVNFFGVKQTNVTRAFTKALRKHPKLGVEIIRLSSSYQGVYYYAKGCEPIDSKRPYYIWMIGNKELLGKLNKKVALTTIQHGYDNYVAFSSTTNVPFDIATSLKKNKVKGNLNVKGQYVFEFMVDMSETLQEEATLMSSRNYVSRTGRNVSVSGVEKVKQGSEYTHILTLTISKILSHVLKPFLLHHQLCQLG